MDRSSLLKARRRAVCCALALLSAFSLHRTVDAQEGDLADGEQLYGNQCKLCHGNPTQARGGDSILPYQQPVRLTMRDHVAQATTDAWPDLGVPPGAAAGAAGSSLLAFAPPFGPPLRGVYGRAAGSVADYQYSPTFLKIMKGVQWDDAALDVWITNSQARAPGAYMFYKQPDANIRRKIILYLKAASSQ